MEEFKTEDEISNDINTLVTVEEQWTKLEQTVWKRRLPTPDSLELELTVWRRNLANTRLALSWLELTVWRKNLANTRLTLSWSRQCGRQLANTRLAVYHASF